MELHVAYSCLSNSPLYTVPPRKKALWGRVQKWGRQIIAAAQCVSTHHSRTLLACIWSIQDCAVCFSTELFVCGTKTGCTHRATLKLDNTHQDECLMSAKILGRGQTVNALPVYNHQNVLDYSGLGLVAQQPHHLNTILFPQ